MEAKACRERRAGGVDLLRLCALAAWYPDVELVCVALRRLAVGTGELVGKRLESGVAEGADAHGRVALLLDDLPELVDACVALPVVDDLNVTLMAHVNVLVHLPLTIDTACCLLWFVVFGAP